MKKRFFIAGGLSLITIFILTGCGASDQFRSWFRQQLLERSGIKADESYIQAEENREAGLLDEEGRFIVQAGSEEQLSAAAGMQGDGGGLASGNDADTAETGERGTVHVTFAENTNLRIAYFLDEGHTMPVVGRDVYLNPGDAVYYENTEAQSLISDQYFFSGFRCYEYFPDGMRKDFFPETDAVLGLTYDAEEVQTLTPGTGEAENSTPGKTEPGGVLRIPANFTGTEVSVEPFGKYVPRAISMAAYWIDASGRENIIRDCTWKINDEVYDVLQTEIRPHISYTVSLEYDPDEYFFVGAAGDIFSCNEKTGRIQFRAVEATGGTGSFRVELHPFTALNISGGSRAVRKVNVIRAADAADIAYPDGSSGRSNDQTEVISKVSDPEIISALKPGNAVSIVVNKGYKLVSDRKPDDYSSTEEGDLYKILISEDDRGNIEIGAEKWAEKTIPVMVDENGFWEKLKNNYLGWVPFLEKEESQDFLVITAGEERCTYSDLINGKTIKMSEKDQLTVTIDQTQLDGFYVKLSADGTEPAVIGKNAEAYTFTYSFYEVSEIAIELEEE